MQICPKSNGRERSKGEIKDKTVNRLNIRPKLKLKTVTRYDNFHYQPISEKRIRNSRNLSLSIDNGVHCATFNKNYIEIMMKVSERMRESARHRLTNVIRCCKQKWRGCVSVLST